MVQFRSARGAKQPPPEFNWGYIDRQTGQRVGPQAKQALAHACEAQHIFYGGAAFGGKSEFAIVEAVTICLLNPGCEVAVFRRKHTELKKSLIPRFRRLVPSHVAKYNKQDHVAEFANGSLLWFCHCQYEDSVYDYQSAEWLALIIDEASHFTEFQVDYLITRVRTSVPGWRVRVILTSNPGNVGHGWLKRRFLAPVPRELGARMMPVPLEVWRPLKTDPDDPTPEADIPTRCFIPAKAEDNPAGLRADPTYLARVWRLGGDKARQLALGDWDANESMIVGSAWKQEHRVSAKDLALRRAFPNVPAGRVIPWHVLSDANWRPGRGAHIYGSLDYGYGAPYSMHLHASMVGGHTRTFFEDYGPKKTDQVQAAILKRALEQETYADGKTPLMEGLQWVVYDPQMANSRAEMGLAKSIIEVYQDAMPRVQFLAGAKGRGARLSRPQRWLDALSTAPDGLPWWSCTTRCEHLIRTVPEVPWDEDDPDVEDGESENHCYEDVGRFFEARPHTPRADSVDPYAHLDPIAKAHHKALDEQLNPAGGDIPQLYVPMR